MIGTTYMKSSVLEHARVPRASFLNWAHCTELEEDGQAKICQSTMF